ncbi:MAG: phospho-sugar mutase [Thermoleophilia bacterium]
MIAPELLARARAWREGDPDPATRAELDALVAAGDARELAGRFAGRLEFGTAGLRGRRGAGPMRMNRLVVRQSAAGVAAYLTARAGDGAPRPVVVVFDARHRSDEFAADVAEVLCAHGVPVILGTRPLPTPVGVFAIRPLGCAAGIVVTASHNPPADSGLKLYLDDAAQIVPPADAEIEAAIARVAGGRAPIVPEGALPAPVDPLPEAVVDDYVEATLARVPPARAPIAIALTAMHGVGGALLVRLLGAAGHAAVHPVARQQEPDGDFPTVAFPNPEEPGATDLLAARMVESGAAIGLALDPDADRAACLVTPAGGGPPVQLSGDDVGALLGDWLLDEVTAGPDRLVVSSVVSSGLLARIAEARGAHHAETLTGFKWLSRPAMEHPRWTQVLAYEEALGYAIGADVRDKDGLSATLALASLASAERARGRTLLDRLDDLHRAHGAHVVENFSLRDESGGGGERRLALVDRLAADPPARLGPRAVAGARRLAADVLRLDLDGGVRVLVRPSGTEPKLKCYCEAVEPVADGDAAAARARARRTLAAVREGLAALLATAGA